MPNGDERVVRLREASSSWCRGHGWVHDLPEKAEYVGPPDRYPRVGSRKGPMCLLRGRAEARVNASLVRKAHLADDPSEHFAGPETVVIVCLCKKRVYYFLDFRHVAIYFRYPTENRIKWWFLVSACCLGFPLISMASADPMLTDRG